jgi:hypothetical protein
VQMLDLQAPVQLHSSVNRCMPQQRSTTLSPSAHLAILHESEPDWHGLIQVSCCWALETYLLVHVAFKLVVKHADSISSHAPPWFLGLRRTLFELIDARSRVYRILVQQVFSAVIF